MLRADAAAIGVRCRRQSVALLGRPGAGCGWVGREHGTEVDERGFVWIGGNADNDTAILKFTLDGKYLWRIGAIAASKGSNDAMMAWQTRRDRNQHDDKQPP
jgi:hypothetical protein